MAGYLDLGSFNPSTYGQAVDLRLILSFEEMRSVGGEKAPDKNVGYLIDSRGQEVPFSIPDNYFCLCKDNDKIYIFNVNSEYIPSTGRFREVVSGTNVIANPDEPGEKTLSKIKIADIVYNIVGGGGGGPSIQEVYIDTELKKMVFKMTDGSTVYCDVSSLFPSYIEDTESTAINYTLVNDENKTFKSIEISSIHLVIPETVKSGFLSMISFKSSTSTIWEVENKSSYNIKYIIDGLQVATLPSLLPGYFYSCGFMCDGLNIYLYIKEIE